MADVIAETVKGVIALFIIVDPLGNIPIFLGLTGEMNKEERRKTLRTATLVGLILLLCFALAGHEIFSFFGITIYSFMIAGGILLLIIAIRILISGGWKENVESSESIGAVPIAVPLLVGPGAITTTILILQSSGIIVALVSVLITFGIVWAVLRFVDPIYKFLGKTGSIVIARILAMFIAAIAMGYILEGLKYYFA
jgi:multiple antibiotic resistance protein